MHRTLVKTSLVLSLAVLTYSPAIAQTGKLTHRQTVKHESLKRATSICISPDGKFAYTAAYGSAAVGVFARDAKTGELKHVQTYEDTDLLAGCVSFRLSADGKLGVAASFRSNTIALFGRNPKTGKLTMFDLVKDGERGAKEMKFVVEAVFSPDSKFVYAIADNSATLITLQVQEGRLLKFLKADKGRDKCFVGVRGLSVSPDGKSIYVTSARADTLTGLSRDPKTGEATIKEVVKKNASGIEALTGIFYPLVSPDGRFVYTSTGRFRGTTAVSLFKRNDDGALKYIESLTELGGLDGGNEIVLSPKGKHLYYCGSKSHSITALERDAKTGKLKVIQTVKDSMKAPLKSVAGLAVSPDGRFVYAAVEGAMSVVVFERK